MKLIYDLSNRPSLVVRWGKFIGHSHQVRNRFSLHLQHDVTAMDLNGPLAGRKFESYLFIQKPLDHEQHDFFLARCQFLVSLTNACQFGLLGVGHAVTCECLSHRVKKLMFAKRLREKLYRSPLSSPAPTSVHLP